MQQALGTEISPELLKGLEENAVAFAQGAGAVLRKHFQTGIKAESKSKTHYDPVTKADRESEAYLRGEIHKAYPNHSILGEEGDDLVGDSDFLWVLDPLDGTANFVNRLPFFAVSVGVLYRGQPVAAAIYTPTSELLKESVFHARLGAQTMLDDVPVRVPENPQPVPSQLSGLPGHYWRSIRFSGEVRRSPGEVRTLGSIALELSMTACGTLQYAIFNAPKIWDVAAGVLLVRQAGGLPLYRQGRGRTWAPLDKFEPLAGPQQGLDGYRKWSGAVIVGNPEIAWSVANSFHRPVRLTQGIHSLVRRIRQLPLWGKGTEGKTSTDGEPPKDAQE